jgi:hypothetical protein
MSVPEKQAWFILIVFAVTMALLGGSILIFGWHEGMLGTLGLYGLIGGVGLIGQREKKGGKIIRDERDDAIERTANLIGYSIFWVILVIATMMPFFIYGPDHIVSVRAGSLTLTIFIALTIVYTIRSLAIIIQYRRASHG